MIRKTGRGKKKEYKRGIHRYIKWDSKTRQVICEGKRKKAAAEPPAGPVSAGDPGAIFPGDSFIYACPDELVIDFTGPVVDALPDTVTSTASNGLRSARVLKRIIIPYGSAARLFREAEKLLKK